MEPLSYDEGLFFSDACVWNAGSVYWSLADYTNEESTLHGCQGAIYRIRWPNP